MDVLANCCSLRDDRKPRIWTPLGKIVGSARETSRGTEYVSFTGVPYAKPPIGSLRFQRPVAVDSWSEPFHATRPCPRPLQLSLTFPGVVGVSGSEDCLKLNIYIQGETHYGSNPTEEQFHPDLLMDSGNVVLVTITYRVGPLGYLCLGTESAPGNLSLWDQVLALKWIKENIRSFGGDPDHVTLAGHGAAAACVSYHLVSHQSSGLFSKAICMSGCFTAHCHSPFKKKPEMVGRAFAETLGCVEDPNDDPDDILARLQSLSGSHIVRNGNFMKEEDHFIPNPWLPVVDKAITRDPFLPLPPVKIIKSGKYNRMPILIGHTRNEGKDTPFSPGTNDRIVDMIGDAYVFGPTEYLVNLVQQSSAQPIYSYSFNHHGNHRRTGNSINGGGSSGGNAATTSGGAGDSSVLRKTSHQFLAPVMGKKLLSQPDDVQSRGVGHGDEMAFLFSTSQKFSLRNIAHLSTQKDLATSAKMIRMWLNFVHTYNPTPNPDQDSTLGPLDWNPRTSENSHHVVIDSHPETLVFDDNHKSRSQFWIKLLNETI